MKKYKLWVEGEIWNESNDWDEMLAMACPFVFEKRDVAIVDTDTGWLYHQFDNGGYITIDESLKRKNG